MLKKEYIIGVDIGGTSITAGLILFNGKDTTVVKKAAIETGTTEKQFLKNIKKLISDVLDKRIIGIGLGCPGPLNYKTGEILNPPNLPISNFNLKYYLESKFSISVYIDNDANCFALGEALCGSARKAATVVGFTLGTGLGGGIIVNKEIYHGNANAGEFWSTIIDLEKMRNSEFYLGKKGVSNLTDHEIHDRKRLYELAKKNDAKAIDYFSKFGSILGIVLSNSISVLDPDMIVIGGSVSRANNLFDKQLKSQIKKLTPWFKGDIAYTKNIEDSPLIGAASLVYSANTIKENIITTEKPWGNFVQYLLNKQCTVKIITVKSGQILSLQSHKFRTELWIMLDDGLVVEIEGKKKRSNKGDEFVIKSNAKHRISFNGPNSARFLEISFGVFDEKDIIRYEDKYGRVKKSKA